MITNSRLVTNILSAALATRIYDSCAFICYGVFRIIYDQTEIVSWRNISRQFYSIFRICLSQTLPDSTKCPDSPKRLDGDSNLTQQSSPSLYQVPTDRVSEHSATICEVARYKQHKMDWGMRSQDAQWHQRPYRYHEWKMSSASYQTTASEYLNLLNISVDSVRVIIIIPAGGI